MTGIHNVKANKGLFVVFLLIALYLSGPAFAEESYKQLTLANGVEVYLISDPVAPVSAASLIVQAGSGDDPEHLAGLAHLLEHAVLLGSKEYPQLGSFNHYFKKHNGWSNGSTRTDHTRYHFQVNNSEFESAVNRLADAIENPIINDSIMTTVIKAVDDEFSGKSMDEWRGTLEVIKGRMKEGHTAAKFDVGNKSIFDKFPDNLQQELVNFHQTYYVGTNIKVVLYSNQQIAELERVALEELSIIRKGLANNRSDKGLVWERPKLNLVNVKSRGTSKSLDVLFPIPSKYFYEKNKVNQLVLNYLGTETQGSLYQHLYDQGLITSLNVNLLGDADYGLLDVYLKLTDKGLQNTDLIVNELFTYIAYLQHSEELLRYFLELKYQAQLSARQELDIEPGDRASLINERMFYLPVNAWIDESKLYKPQYVTSDDINKFKGFLSTENALIVKTSPEANTDKISPIYKLQYKLKNIKLIKNDLENKTAYSLPQANPFLNPEYSQTPARPESTLSEKRYFQGHDLDIWVESGSHQAEVISSLSIFAFREDLEADEASYLNRVIKTKALMFELSDFLYHAQSAGYKVRISATSQGYKIDVSGNSVHFEKIINTILHQVYSNEVSQPEFNRAREASLAAVDGILQGSLESRVRRRIQDVVKARFSLTNGSLDYLRRVTFDDYTQWHHLQPANYKLRAVLIGDFNQKHLARYFNTSSLEPKEFKALSPKLELKTSHSLNSSYDDGVCALTVDLRDNPAFAYLLSAIIRKDFYNELRSKKQLGYFVSAELIKGWGGPFLSFQVQSPNYDSKQLCSEVSVFLAGYHESLKNMDEGDFNKMRASVRTALLTPFANVHKHQAVLNEEVIGGFAAREEIAQQLALLDQARFLALYQSLIFEQKAARIKVTVN
ncbi:insulinase family protein [Pseudoalteromonas sp. T1lg22]|uniref:insulinase family protein n=1 Tax=Pseudoalteromonas sp. T1lg22 TaxID=2077096 RepID=UPI000CF74E22|nr:insulinase family protein [Pseudoalteromonas sp. T1lg22]